MTFAHVKSILDKALADWKTTNGAAPDMSVHNQGGHPPISWSSAAELRGAWGKGVQLIQPEVVGNGRGAEANLIIDLKTGLKGKPRMPIGGPYLSPPDIQVIIDWIDGGCLDDPVA